MKSPNLLWISIALCSLFTLIFAQGQVLPGCAAQCFESSLREQTECAPSNTTCICTNGPLNAAIQACVGQKCTIRETLVALNVTSTQCERPIRDRTGITNILCGVFGSLAVIAVTVRTWHAFSMGTFAKDDACALAAGVFLIVDNAVTFPTGPAGFGRDVWTVPFDNITYILKMIYLMQNFYWPVSALTKLAFLFFFLRIFPDQALRRYIYATMALTTSYWIAFQFGNLFYCRPVSLVWEGWDGEHPGKCLDINKFMVSATAINIFIDIIIIILPISSLLKLSLSWRKKFGLVAMFTVGGFTLIVSIIRIQSILNYARSQNGTYDNVPAGYWSLMEVNVGVFCVCMPALRRVLGHHIPRIFGSTQDSKAKPNYSYNGTPIGANKSDRRRRPTFGGSLLADTTITKTMSVRISGRTGEDDQINLVDVERPKRQEDETQSQGSRSTANVSKV